MINFPNREGFQWFCKITRFSAPEPAKEQGLTEYAFFFGDYNLEVTYCTSADSARDHAVKLAIKFNEPVRRAYKQNASMKWKRAKNLF